MSDNRFSCELRQYSKRILFCGLSGRISDRHFLKIMMQEGRQPVAIIEEYEHREEVEKFLNEHPNWKPIVRYVSANPQLQDKYPMFTKEEFEQFLIQHQIGFCVLSMVDHETDHFVRLNPNTEIAKNLSARATLENQFGSFVGRFISNVYDNPTMFHYLSADRLHELKTNLYYNKNMARSLNISRRELVETTLFMSYLIECLDGRNATLPVFENQLMGAVAANMEKTNMRSVSSGEIRETTEPAVSKETWDTTKSTRMRHHLIMEEVKNLFQEITEAVFHNANNQNGTHIKELTEKMNQFVPEIKRMHRKTQERILRYVRNTCAFLSSSINTTQSNSARRLYEELSRVLAESVLTNGERELQRTQQKERAKWQESTQHRAAIARAAAKEEKKKVSRAQQRFDDIAAQERRTPEEVAEAERKKQIRREEDKARKIAKKAARKRKNIVNNQDMVVAVGTTKTSTPIASQEIVGLSYILGQMMSFNRNVDNTVQSNSVLIKHEDTPFYSSLFPSGVQQQHRVCSNRVILNNPKVKNNNLVHVRSSDS